MQKLPGVMGLNLQTTQTSRKKILGRITINIKVRRVIEQIDQSRTRKGVQKIFRDGGIKKQRSQRKLSSKDVIVKTISITKKTLRT